ncbi:hypothetical protein Vretifemale_12109 [Volvox reticuliferus]|uniref:Uncharacterized protein n=2 Tax=Volvox reticuliferus TaxID=1737510 RepID=A0A8J4CHM3_9CHLO|nr:hypothetical protein Vretifemale_12109 [Volvox reticuliferus]
MFSRQVSQNPSFRNGHDVMQHMHAVPPAVAAIASLTQLRCLELYGTSIVRVLDPPNRLSGLSALRNLSRLRVDLPVNTEDRYPSSATFAAATPDSAGAWCLAPTLATLTWLQDLDLGASYTVPPDALPSLEALSKLSRLCCGTLIAPPRQYRRRMHPYELHHLQEEDFQQQEEQLQQWPFVRLPLPASLEQLQVASLPTAPVLAAIAALPNIKVLTLTGRGVPGAAVTRGGAGSGSLRPGGGNTAVEGQKAGSATGPACGGASSSSALHTCEPLRLTLADEPSPREYEHLAAARMVDEVAVAAVLLRRLLPPSLLRRVALQPYSWLPTTKLQGPHAAWLSELAPLGEVVEAVELVAFALGPGDLAALRAALPNLKMLSLYVCRLDADDIRHLQDVPSLALRVDASCEYACMYGNEYDAAGLDAGSEDFVDEAEAQDLDPDHQGLWPVAAELQWAYERALDATDDEEGEGEEEGGELAEAEEGEADQAASDAWVG